MGPIFPRNFGKTPNTFHPGRFLQVSVICGIFKGKTFYPFEVRLVLFPNLLIDSFNIPKLIWPVSENNLLAPMLIDAIECLRILKSAYFA